MIVLLDTNFFMIPGQFKIDILEEIKKIIPDAKIKTVSQVVDELKNIHNPPAKIGLALIKNKKIEIINKRGKADNVLLETAIEKKAALATNDKELRQRAKKKNIKIIFMRQKRKIDMMG